jgi:hypothetical protein
MTEAGRATPRTSSRKKLQWTAVGPRDHRDWGAQWAMGDRGERYDIDGSGNSWRAVVKHADGKTAVLVSGVSAPRAYQACVRDYHGPI